MEIAAPQDCAHVDNGTFSGSLSGNGYSARIHIPSRRLGSLKGVGRHVLYRGKNYVLDVACGTGETACFLAETFGCHIVGIDASDLQTKRAQRKKARCDLPVEFHQADAHHLSFPDDTFDAVFCEWTLCHLDIGQALKEMMRVTKPGGRMGIHGLCWKENVRDTIKQRF